MTNPRIWTPSGHRIIFDDESSLFCLNAEIVSLIDTAVNCGVLRLVTDGIEIDRITPLED